MLRLVVLMLCACASVGSAPILAGSLETKAMTDRLVEALSAETQHKSTATDRQKAMAEDAIEQLRNNDMRTPIQDTIAILNLELAGTARIVANLAADGVDRRLRQMLQRRVAEQLLTSAVSSTEVSFQMEVSKRLTMPLIVPKSPLAKGVAAYITRLMLQRLRQGVFDELVPVLLSHIDQQPLAPVVPPQPQPTLASRHALVQKWIATTNLDAPLDVPDRQLSNHQHPFADTNVSGIVDPIRHFLKQQIANLGVDASEPTSSLLLSHCHDEVVRFVVDVVRRDVLSRLLAAFTMVMFHEKPRKDRRVVLNHLLSLVTPAGPQGSPLQLPAASNEVIGLVRRLTVDLHQLIAGRIYLELEPATGSSNQDPIILEIVAKMKCAMNIDLDQYVSKELKSEIATPQFNPIASKSSGASTWTSAKWKNFGVAFMEKFVRQEAEWHVSGVADMLHSHCWILLSELKSVLIREFFLFRQALHDSGNNDVLEDVKELLRGINRLVFRYQAIECSESPVAKMTSSIFKKHMVEILLALNNWYFQRSDCHVLFLDDHR